MYIISMWLPKERLKYIKLVGRGDPRGDPNVALQRVLTSDFIVVAWVAAGIAVLGKWATGGVPMQPTPANQHVWPVHCMRRT